MHQKKFDIVRVKTQLYIYTYNAVGTSLKQLKKAGNLCALALDLIDMTLHANKSD